MELKVPLDPCPTDWSGREIKPETRKNTREKKRWRRVLDEVMLAIGQVFIICVVEWWVCEIYYKKTLA